MESPRGFDEHPIPTLPHPPCSDPATRERRATRAWRIAPEAAAHPGSPSVARGPMRLPHPQERGATQVQGARESGQLPPGRHRKSRAHDPGEGPRVSAFVRQGGPAGEGRGQVWEDPFPAKLGQGNPPGNRDLGDGWHSPTPLLPLRSKPKFKWKG